MLCEQLGAFNTGLWSAEILRSSISCGNTSACQFPSMLADQVDIVEAGDSKTLSSGCTTQSLHYNGSVTRKVNPAPCPSVTSTHTACFRLAFAMILPQLDCHLCSVPWRTPCASVISVSHVRNFEQKTLFFGAVRKFGT